MSLSIGIVGLPNVGKSTLFNAITQLQIEAQNYPFCTIEPNSGNVSVPDSRLAVLSSLSGSEKCINATIEFVDIAGLVKGASKGEGLGNQFLSNIRNTSALAHVVRCFDDSDIVHVHGEVNPLSDIEIINTELILADLEMAEKACQNQQKRAKAQDKDAKQLLELLERIRAHLSTSQPVRSLDLSEDDQLLIRSYGFITLKKVIYVANVDEGDVVSGNAFVDQVREYAADFGDEVVIISAKMEEELSVLSEEEKQEFLSEYGLSESGLDKLSKACYSLLGLHTYLTTGQKETRAWTIPVGATAPQAAGVIHTDFEKGFIRANVVSYDTFVSHKSLKAARDAGELRQEGKDYIMQDGDVVEFLFNT